MLEFLQNYMDNFSYTPKEYYDSLAQATINARWDDTTLIRTIKEENFPFDNIYTEHEVWLDTISDVTVSTLKVIGNYISIMFKDIDHPRNYRGQKYKWVEDGRNYESTYLCYDMMNPLSQIADCKLIKCNNKINLLNKKTGHIHTEPLFVGWQISSTNNQVNVDGTVEQRRLICLIQENEYTKKIVENQRFIISGNKAFKVTQVDNSNLENIEDNFGTMITLFIEWTPILVSDNLELGIADYYDYQYKLKINQQSPIEQKQGFIGQLTATVMLNDEVINMPLKWSTSDLESITIDSQGSYRIIGEVGSTSLITCSIDKNEQVFDTIEIKIVEDYLPEKVLIVEPIITELRQGFSTEFKCGVYIEGEKQSDIVICIPNWTGINYTLVETIDGYKLTNNKMSSNKLELTFSSVDLEPIIMEIELRGLF